MGRRRPKRMAREGADFGGGERRENGHFYFPSFSPLAPPRRSVGTFDRPWEKTAVAAGGKGKRKMKMDRGGFSDILFLSVREGGGGGGGERR